MCDGCKITLMYAYGAQSVKCAVCNSVTHVPPNQLRLQQNQNTLTSATSASGTSVPTAANTSTSNATNTANSNMMATATLNPGHHHHHHHHPSQQQNQSNAIDGNYYYCFFCIYHLMLFSCKFKDCSSRKSTIIG